MGELCILQQQSVLVKPLGDVSIGSHRSAARSRFPRIRVFYLLWLSLSAVFRHIPLILPYQEQMTLEMCMHHFWREDNMQICTERTDVPARKVGKATAINSNQKWTLKRTVAKQSMIRYPQYSRKRLFNKAERQQM